MAKMPIRNKSKDNPYTLDYDENNNKYTVEFKDINNQYHKVEVAILSIASQKEIFYA